MRRNCYLLLFAAILIGFFLLVCPVFAVTITESPDFIQKGQQITLTINDLNDGSQFSLLIGGQFSTTPNAAFTFETDNFNMPISLNNGQISATTQGTTVTSLSVQKGDSLVAVRQKAINGLFTFSQPYTVSSGVYDFLKLGGTARSDVSQISTQMNLLGTKQGPANSQITFTVNGITDGQVQLIVFVDNTQELFKTVKVGNGIATTTTVPVTTITQTTTTTAQPTGTTTQVGITQTTTTAQPTDTTTQVGVSQTTTVQPSGTTTGTGTTTAIPSGTATYYPVVTSTTPVTPVVTPQTFSSADQKVSLTTTGVDYAGLLMVKATGVPDTWLPVYDPYAIAPDTLTFPSPATISFAIPASQGSGSSYAYFIGRYLDNEWTAVPSTLGTGTINAEIDRAGTYGLMAFKPESTIQPTVTGTQQQATTPTPLVQVTSTPRIASIAQATPAAASAAKSSATHAPLETTVALSALLACGAIVLLKRR
jgi:hypothetical protein